MQSGIQTDPEMQFSMYAVGLAPGASTVSVVIASKCPELNQLEHVTYTAEVSLTVRA